MIKQNLKLFFKTKIIFIPVIILLVCFLGNLVYSCYSFSLNSDVLIYLKNSIKLCLLSFVILCFTSYEFFYLYKRCYIDEALYSHKNGKTRILTSTVTVLLFIPALEFFSAFVFNFVIFLSSGMNDYSYLYHIFSVLFLYVFLGGIIPILLGVFFAQKRRRSRKNSRLSVPALNVSCATYSVSLCMRRRPMQRGNIPISVPGTMTAWAGWPVLSAMESPMNTSTMHMVTWKRSVPTGNA